MPLKDVHIRNAKPREKPYKIFDELGLFAIITVAGKKWWRFRYTLEWRYNITKTNTPHIVPLATQAVVILRELHALTGNGRYVFPGARSNLRPMSDNAILAAAWVLLKMR